MPLSAHYRNAFGTGPGSAVGDAPLPANVHRAEVRQQTAVDLTNLLFDAELPEAQRQDVLRLITWLSEKR
jgi:hypothetical protein